MATYDLIVVGEGVTGLACARHAASLGLKTATTEWPCGQGQSIAVRADSYSGFVDDFIAAHDPGGGTQNPPDGSGSDNGGTGSGSGGSGGDDSSSGSGCQTGANAGGGSLLLGLALLALRRRRR